MEMVESPCLNWKDKLYLSRCDYLLTAILISHVVFSELLFSGCTQMRGQYTVFLGSRPSLQAQSKILLPPHPIRSS